MNDSNADTQTKQASSALAYATERHWHVFPAPPGEKKSHKSAKFSDGRKWGATTDAAEIRRDFRNWPDANVGIVTGPKSGIWVVEADTAEGHNVDGIASLRELETRHGTLPDTLMAESPSGSPHYYFKWIDGIKNSSGKIAPGVDVRGDGGMVIAPPSVMPGKGAYRWLNDLPVADAPQWLIDLILADERKGKDSPLRQEQWPLPDWMAALCKDLPPGTGVGISNRPEDNFYREIGAALAATKNNDLGWDKWNRKGMSIFKATGGNLEGKPLFHKWSAKSKKYDEATTNEKWMDYYTSPPDRIGIGSIFYDADQDDPEWRQRFKDYEASQDDPDWWRRFKKPQPETEKSQPETESQPNDGSKTTGASEQQNANSDPGPKTDDKQQQGATSGWQAAIPLINISTWDDEPVPQQEWSVPDKIPFGKTTLFSGEGAAGKSLIELQLSAAAALGRDWLGVTPAEGTTLFIDAEDDEQVIHKRLADILRHYGAKFADVKDRLHLVSLAGKDSVLGFYSRDRSAIKPTQLYNHLLEMAGDLKPKIIGIASSADVFAGNEIDRSQVQQFIGLLTRLAMVAKGSTVLIAHPSLTGISSDTGLSGTTQWHNSVRARFYLKSMKSPEGEQADSNLREIVFKKNNYGPISASIPLRYQNGLFLPISETTLNVEARREQISAVFIAILKRFNGENRNCSANNGVSYAPTLFAKEREAKAAAASKEDLAGAMRTLLEGRVILQENYGKPSNPHYRLVYNIHQERGEPEPF